MRMTKNRAKILNIIESSKAPLTAEEIYRKVEMNLSTVYRALKFLEQRKLIGSFSIGGGAKYFFKKDRHYHFMVCEKCGEIFPFRECANDFIESLQTKYGFSERYHLFLVYGICEKCGKEVKK
ncbi:Fur family transcriptional regulator [Thermotoga sp. KOL6]|uniref:Fur family transcriptional regulator n=1 Tax=Thermotoga sp. KOL6 TaxID=126741 RepID=UPI000C78AC1B|nr:Fur family transcriptional regulator [Thermotoga sp. KOL6]PLV58717.1 Fur family transcriptional regulator [Thermotoga sp. KOL6]